MNPDLENGSLGWHKIKRNHFPGLLTVDQILPDVALEAHALKYEAAVGEKAFVVVDGGDNEPDNGAEHSNYSHEYEKQRSKVQETKVGFFHAMDLHGTNGQNHCAIDRYKREVDARDS